MRRMVLRLAVCLLIVLTVPLTLLGFAFGFLLGAIPAYVIVHLIFYLNFDRLIKTSIPFAAMVFLVFAAIIVCNFDVLGYNRYLPNLEDVESAGFLYTSDVLDGGKTETGTGSKAVRKETHR